MGSVASKSKWDMFEWRDSLSERVCHKLEAVGSKSWFQVDPYGSQDTRLENGGHTICSEGQGNMGVQGNLMSRLLKELIQDN